MFFKVTCVSLCRNNYYYLLEKVEFFKKKNQIICVKFRKLLYFLELPDRNVLKMSKKREHHFPTAPSSLLMLRKNH